MTQLRYLAEEQQFLKKTSCKTYLAMTLWNQFLSNDYIKTFHTSTSPSKPVDIICLPSGENHTHAIACECPFYSLIHFPDEYSQSLTIPREPPVTKYLHHLRSRHWKAHLIHLDLVMKQEQRQVIPFSYPSRL